MQQDEQNSSSGFTAVFLNCDFQPSTFKVPFPHCQEGFTNGGASCMCRVYTDVDVIHTGSRCYGFPVAGEVAE